MDNLSYIQVKKEETDDEEDSTPIKMRLKPDNVKSEDTDDECFADGGDKRKRIKTEEGYYSSIKEETDDEGENGSEGNDSDSIELGDNKSRTAEAEGGEAITTEVKNIALGDVGYEFRKKFDAGWFTGVVTEIRPLAGEC